MIALMFTIKMEDGHDLSLRLKPPDGHIYMPIAQLTILINLTSYDCNDRPHNLLRFDTISTIKTTIVTMNDVCIMISTWHRWMMQIEFFF